MNQKQREARAEREVKKWNAEHPVGTTVRYWRMAKEGPPSGTGKTRSAAWSMCGHASVLIEGTSGSIALSHVEVVMKREHGHGCCVDKACDEATCMELPVGQTCSDCVHLKRCLAFGYTETAGSTSCDFFPRRFRLRVVGAAG